MLKVVTGDITKYPCDVIVNSLGVVTTDYGGICKSILKASNSKELKNIIDRANDVYDIGEYFFTDGFGMPVQAICHLITPHHDDDDKNLNVMVYSVKNILMSCRELKYKKIGIPLIGAGANCYTKEEVFGVLKAVCEAFCAFFPSMDVTIVFAEDAISDENTSRLLSEYNRRGGQYHYDETMKKFKKSTKYFKDYYEYDDQIIKLNKEFFNRPSTAFDTKGKMNFKGIDTIPTYINRYIDCKYDGDAYKKAKKNVYGYLGYGKSNSIDSGMNTFKKLKTSAEKVTFFKLCLAVRMNYQDANDFLNFFGYSFASAGINKTDDVMRQILFKHIYGVVEVNKEWEEAGLNPPLFK